MNAAAILKLTELLADLTVGILTALELNQTHRLPALRRHAEAVKGMLAAGRDPDQAEIDMLAQGISDDIAAVQRRAQDAGS